MVTSSTIASFDVKLTSEGLLVIETKLAKGEDFIEVMDICEAVRKFLIDKVLPIKRGELVEKDLTLVA